MFDQARWKRVTLVLGALVALALACDGYRAWDDMFTRTSLSLETKGWTGGDAAVSTPLPGGRTLYLFGDSYVTNRTSDNRRVQLGPDPDPWTPLRHTVFGNTIGVQNGASPGVDAIRFHARVNGAASDITSIPNAAFAPHQQFFDHAALGLAPQDNRYFWPIGAECYDCASTANARLLVAFTEWGTCSPAETPDPNVCVPLCGLTSPGAECTQGVSLTGNVIAKFKNVDQPPSAWQRDGAALRIAGNNTQTLWGGSFLIEGSQVYVYGLRPAGLGQHDLLVRKTTLSGLTSGSSSQWTVWRTNTRGAGQWLTGTRPMRAVAMGVPSYFSVDKVTRSNLSRYLLTYTQLGQKLYLRVSSATLNGSSQAATWVDETITTPRLDLYSLDQTIRTTVAASIVQGCQPDNSGALPSYAGCAVTYHGLALGHLASSDGNGPKTIPISYIVTYGPNPYFDPAQPEGPHNQRMGAESADYYRPRFTYADLSLLEPWCTGNCWRGIAHRYVAPSLSSALSFDVTDVTSGRTFYASLVPGAGTPTLSVEYTDGTNVLRTDLCGPATAPVCNAAPPINTRIANVKLAGPPGSSALLVDVHHAGHF